MSCYTLKEVSEIIDNQVKIRDEIYWYFPKIGQQKQNLEFYKCFFLTLILKVFYILLDQKCLKALLLMGNTGQYYKKKISFRPTQKWCSSYHALPSPHSPESHTLSMTCVCYMRVNKNVVLCVIFLGEIEQNSEITCRDCIYFWLDWESFAKKG